VWQVGAFLLEMTTRWCWTLGTPEYEAGMPTTDRNVLPEVDPGSHPKFFPEFVLYSRHCAQWHWVGSIETCLGTPDMASRTNNSAPHFKPLGALHCFETDKFNFTLKKKFRQSFTLCKRNVCRNSQNARVYYYSEASINCDDLQHVRGFFRALWELNAENMYEVQTDDVTENCWKLHKEEYRCDIPGAIKYEETSTEHAACLREWETIQTIVSPNCFARGPLLASKNNHGSSHPFSRKYSQFWWQV